MNKSLTQNEVRLAALSLVHRNVILAIAAIVKSIPKELLNREAVLKNLANLPLYDGVVQKDAEARKEVEKLVDLILGPP